MTDPANKTVLVTGAGGGFGLEMVRQFRAAGSKLIVTDVSEKALATASDQAGESLVASEVADLATEEGCYAIAELCALHGVTPDILVNNAGIAVAGPFARVPQAEWEKLVQINLLAPMRLCNLFIPAMVERGSGHIVNISSVAGWFGAQGLSAYCASKFGLRGFGESLAGDLHGTGVRVTTVCPSFSRTPILDSPQYGYEQSRAVPDYLLSKPEDVVGRMIKGVRRNRRYVFPDPWAKLLSRVVRFTPWFVPLLDRRLHAQSIEAGQAKE